MIGVNYRVLLAVFCAVSLQGASLELSSETLQAWDQYVQGTETRLKKNAQPDGQFLWADGKPERTKRVRAGDIPVGPGQEPNPRRVPNGLIHHWIGAVYLPATRAADVKRMLRDYGRYKEIFRPGIIDARLTQRDGERDGMEMLLRSGRYFKSTAFDGEYDVNFFQTDAARWYSVIAAKSMREIEQYGSPVERKLQPDHGIGLVWRLNVITRAEERDGGVIFEVEALILSRDVPAALRWIAGPIIRRVASETLADTLRKTRTAAARPSAQRRFPMPASSSWTSTVWPSRSMALR